MSVAAIQPIETVHRGYRFRSRLEARWAVAFDHLGLDWTYEPEGYRFGQDDWYLPDFKLTFAGSRRFSVYAEVKGDIHSFGEWDKLWRFALHHPLLILSQIPEPEPGAPVPLFTLLTAFRGQLRSVWLHFDGGGRFDVLTQWFPGEPPETGLRMPAYSKVEQAFAAARSARFEHGEHP